MNLYNLQKIISVTLCVFISYSSQAFSESLTNKIDLYEAASTSAYVPTLDTIKLITADGELNRELKNFMLKKRDSTTLKGKKIAILATDGVEELEILVPLNYLKESGAEVFVVSPKKPNFPDTFGVKMPEIRSTHIMTVRLMENSGWIKIDKFLEDVSVEDFDGLVLPGGSWNPDFLRTNTDAHTLLQAFVETNKPLASICHGPLILVNAGLLKGRKVTGYWSIMKDLENAGATVIDQPLVTDGQLLTSRFPYDLPRLMKAFTEHLIR